MSLPAEALQVSLTVCYLLNDVLVEVGLSQPVQSGLYFDKFLTRREIAILLSCILSDSAAARRAIQGCFVNPDRVV